LQTQWGRTISLQAGLEHFATAGMVSLLLFERLLSLRALETFFFGTAIEVHLLIADRTICSAVIFFDYFSSFSSSRVARIASLGSISRSLHPQ
jgi:hypothetical protein